MSKLFNFLRKSKPAPHSSRDKGSVGEGMAVKYLKKKKYIILAQNYRKPFGEIDIICRDGNTLVFVEVKTAKQKKFGAPQDWVGRKKQLQIAKVASSYLIEGEFREEDCRFDVIGISINEKGIPDIVHLRDAFRL